MKYEPKKNEVWEAKGYTIPFENGVGSFKLKTTLDSNIKVGLVLEYLTLHSIPSVSDTYQWTANW